MNTELMKNDLAAARGGDWERAFGYFADDIVLRVPGRSELAGVVRGRDAAIAYLEAALASAHGDRVEVEPVDMLSSEERVVLILRERFARPEGDVEFLRANCYRLAEGKIAEITIFEANQYEVDELFA
jgi:ketosteroid isomerase-like protein